MELLPVLRLISRRRRLLGMGAVVAVLTLFLLGGPTAPGTSSMLASTSIALDTPKSQLVDAAPKGADTLGWRASLLSHLMTTDSTTQAVARRLGVTSDQVAVIDPTFALPLVRSNTAQAATKAASGTVAPYVLTVSSAEGSLPVIWIRAAAPDRGRAVALAQAAVAVLQTQASPGGRFTSQVMTNAANLRLQRFVVVQTAPIRVKPVSSSSLRMKAIGGSFFVFIVWCAGVVLVPRFTRVTRAGARTVPA